MWFVLWLAIVGPLENAFFGWVDHKYGLDNQLMETILRYTVVVGVPSLSVAVGFYLFYVVREKFRPTKNDQVALSPTYGIGIAEDRNSESFDVSQWVGHISYFAWQAACLWENVRPVERIPTSHPAYGSLAMLKRELESGQIKSLNGKINMDGQIKREDLVMLANIRRVRPKFLFPEADEQRAKSDLREGYNKATFNLSKANYDAAILRLAQLRSSGVVIRNDAANVSEFTLVEWIGRVEKWMKETIETIYCISPTDSELFRTLDVVPAARVQVPVALTNTMQIGALVKAYNEHDYRLVRLVELIAKYRAT